MKIDCSYTKNYLAEKKRMLEQNENNCSMRCAECPFSCDENGKDLFCTQFEMLYPK